MIELNCRHGGDSPIADPRIPCRRVAIASDCIGIVIYGRLGSSLSSFQGHQDEFARPALS
jgi:hypothetical protein